MCTHWTLTFIYCLLFLKIKRKILITTPIKFFIILTDFSYFFTWRIHISSSDFSILLLLIIVLFYLFFCFVRADITGTADWNIFNFFSNVWIFVQLFSFNFTLLFSRTTIYTIRKCLQWIDWLFKFEVRVLLKYQYFFLIILILHQLNGHLRPDGFSPFE